jgi:hypothetical protein
MYALPRMIAVALLATLYAVGIVWLADRGGDTLAPQYVVCARREPFVRRLPRRPRPSVPSHRTQQDNAESTRGRECTRLCNWWVEEAKWRHLEASARVPAL